MQQLAEDHPHACGDKVDRVSCDRQCEGSSPRVWGQAHIRYHIGKLPGIIPTRVGTSIRRTQHTCSRTNHPHACGDK